MDHSPEFILKASHVSKTIMSGATELTILTDINLAVKPAESVAIVGVSGSGKSTLLGLLAGLDKPTSGDIYLKNYHLNTLSEERGARLRLDDVGFIFQSFMLFPHLNALENVMLPLELRNTANAKQNALALLEKVGLKDRAKHYPHQLSGGEQQRVAIARAFITQPAILFADEITGSLDKKTGAVITELLFALNSEQKTTLLLVTHDEALAKRCGRRLHLEDGRFV